MANNKDFKVKNGLVAGGTIESTTGGIKFPDGTTQTTAVTASGEVNDLSSVVTWANVPDANITQSSVTQHEGALSITESQISDLGSYATLASPALTGTPTAPTATAGTNTTQLATTAFVSTAVADIVDSAPGTLDTLNELAAALGDDPNFATTVTNSIATKAPLASPALTGTPTAPTAAASTNTTQIATTAYVQGELSGVSVAFDDLTGKASGTGTYSTTGYLTSGLGSGGVSLTYNDGGGNANVTFNHRSMTPEQTGNAGRIHVNTDITTGASMQFQVGSGLTSGVSQGITTYFKIEENLLTSNAVFNMPDTKVLQFGTGADWKWQFDSTDAYMTLDSGTWRWRDGANSNAVRVQWTPSAGLEFQDGHQLQLGSSNDLRMYHSSNVNYFDLVNGDLKIRDVSGTATDRYVFTQAGNLGIGDDSPDVALSVATDDNTDTGPDKAIRLGHASNSARSAVLTKSRDFNANRAELKLEISTGANGSPLTFYSNVNDETMRLDENGNLGIGTTSPDAKLHVREDSTATYLATFEGDLGTNNNRTLRLKTPDTDSDSEPFTWQTSNSVAWQIDATEAMRLNSAGNLGIGTAAPDVELHVAGGLRVGESSDFDSGTDVNQTASIMLPEHGVIGFDTGEFIRTLISKDSSGHINVGQSGTAIISRVNLLPGTSGSVRVESGNNSGLMINNNGSGSARLQYQIAGSGKYSVGVQVNGNYTIYDIVNVTTPFRIEPGSGNDGALVIDGNGDITTPNTITADEVQARVTSSTTTTGTLTASDANTKVTMTGDITVPNSTFATDDIIMFDGNGTDRTLTPASGLTIYVDGAAASSIDVGANKIIGLTFRSGTVAIATGVDATTSTTYLYSATSTDTTTNHNVGFTPTVVDFDTELINQGSFTESGGRITVPVAGVYRIYGQVTFTRGGTEQRLSLQLQIFKNATAESGRARGSYIRGTAAVDDATAYIEDFVNCAASDILDIRAYRDGVVGTSILNANQSRLLIQRIG